MELDNFFWHDAIVNNIRINRENPGNNDVIQFEITWPNGKSGFVIFEEVYWARMSLNFGVVAPETIDTVCTTSDDDIDRVNFYKRWKGLLDDVELTCYVIKTLSTGSDIKILAKSIKIID